MDLISLLITVLVLGLVFYVIYWAIGQIPLPEPFRVVALVILAIMVVIVLLNLIGFVGSPPRIMIR